MGLGDLIGKIKQRSGFVERIFGGFSDLIKNLCANKGTRGIIIFFAALAVLVPIGTVLVVKTGGTSPPKTLTREFVPARIPDEDIFLPNEPDFLPPVILEQEQRKSWTVEDVEPFWTDPIEYGPAFWQERIGETVDDLLEHIP
jgi:hypothetical protein